jgi:MoxR-like ATPase
MFAVILQESTNMGIKQYAIIPQSDGGVRQLMRDGKNLRGTAGAWRHATATDLANLTGYAVGKPVAIPITASDYRDLLYPLTPTTLVQKLVRTVKDDNIAGSTAFAEQYDEVMDTLNENPALLARYVGKQQPAVVSPAIQVVHQAQPEVVSVPAGNFIPYYPENEVVLPNYETENQMNYGTIAPSMAESHAVLTIPEAEAYFKRKFFGLDETQVYDDARAAGDNVLLTGEAGTGKTSSARNYAVERGLPFVTVECTQQITESITQGRFVPTGVGNATKWKYSQLATAIQQPSVILINELTRMTPKAASLFLRLLQERELVIEPLNEVIKVHPEVLFIADQNTGMGYTGTSRQDAALIDRFNIKLEFQYDTNIENKFIASPTLLTFAGNIRDAAELNDEFSVPMSTRILKNFVAQAKRLNFEFAVNSLLSNYPKMDGERDAIKMRFDADASAIADELQVPIGKYITA